MTLDFWRRTLIASVIVTLLAGLCSAVCFDMIWAGRYTLVSLWTVVNFWLLGRVLQLIVRRSSAWRIALWVLLKLGGWYPLGYLMLKHIGAEATSALAGFHTFFLVLILRALGRKWAGGRNVQPKPVIDSNADG